MKAKRNGCFLDRLFWLLWQQVLDTGNGSESAITLYRMLDKQIPLTGDALWILRTGSKGKRKSE